METNKFVYVINGKFYTFEVPLNECTLSILPSQLYDEIQSKLREKLSDDRCGIDYDENDLHVSARLHYTSPKDLCEVNLANVEVEIVIEILSPEIDCSKREEHIRNLDDMMTEQEYIDFKVAILRYVKEQLNSI